MRGLGGYNSGRPETDAMQAARARMLTQRGWTRLAGGRWISPYTGFSFDTRAALDIEQLRGNFQKKMQAAFV